MLLSGFALVFRQSSSPWTEGGDIARSCRSRKYPARTRKTRGSDRSQHGTETAVQRPFSRFAAGRKHGPGHALKVETRVRTPLGLPAKPQVRAPSPLQRIRWLAAGT